MKDQWFKRRRYGYGWIPTTWQGWLTVLVYIVIVLASSLMLRDVPEGAFTFEVGLFFIVLAVATTQLILISYKKGPKPKWRWGKRPDDNPEEDW